jgi:hypothetical protein
MKKLLYLLALILLLASCDQVIFPEPQPQKVKTMTEMPAEIQGVYLDQDGDSLFVFEQSFSYYSDNYTDFNSVYLSDSLVLKSYKKRYFISISTHINEQVYWLTYIIEAKNDGRVLDIYTMDPGDIVKLAKLEEITSKVMDIEGETDYYLFNPSKKDYKKIISDTIFTKMISFQKISTLK